MVRALFEQCFVVMDSERNRTWCPGNDGGAWKKSEKNGFMVLACGLNVGAIYLQGEVQNTYSEREYPGVVEPKRVRVLSQFRCYANSTHSAGIRDTPTSDMLANDPIGRGEPYAGEGAYLQSDTRCLSLSLAEKSGFVYETRLMFETTRDVSFKKTSARTQLYLESIAVCECSLNAVWRAVFLGSLNTLASDR